MLLIVRCDSNICDLTDTIKQNNSIVVKIETHNQLYTHCLIIVTLIKHMPQLSNNKQWKNLIKGIFKPTIVCYKHYYKTSE